MTPEVDRSLPPNLSAMGEVKFQDFCAELMHQDPTYLNPIVYGRRGQGQKGIDIVAPLRDKTGIHVGQCKAWTKPSPGEIRNATDEFLPNLKFWQDHGLKKFILLMGCRLGDQNSQDQLLEETKKFKALGLDYECWDACILTRMLRPHPHIVRTYCEPAEYWVACICGTGAVSLGKSGQMGTESILAHQGTLILELSDARSDQLSAILERWEEGENQEAFRRIIEFSQTTTWPELTAEVRAKTLRIRAALTLATTGDTGEARQLLEQVRLLAPDSCTALEASVARYELGVSAGLESLKAPNNLDAWNVRLGLLLEAGKPEEVLAELPKLPTQTTRNPNTVWAEAMALLCLRRVDEARRVLVEARNRHPRSFKLRMAMAMVRYASGISTVLPAWGHLTWPVPPPWHLVKRDEEACKQRAQAAEDFAELATKATGDERREILIWRVACLANEPRLQGEAAALCNSLLAESPGYMPAAVWAQERKFDFDKAASITALRSRLRTTDVQADEIITLFSLVADTEGIVAGEKLLDDQRAAFERTGSLSVWHAHKVQCLIARAENQAALGLVNDEPDPLRKRQVRQAMLGASARKQGNHESLAADYENEFLETGDGDALFSCCLSKRMAGNWSFVADHARQLVALVSTDAALRVAAEGALNARRPELVLELVRDHVALCPGGALPPDLQRLQGEAFKQLGKINKAVEAVEKAASVSPDLNTLMHLFQMKRSKGDLVGSAETARQFLKLPDVPPQFLTEEVAPAIRRVAPELTRELVLKAKDSLPEDSPALVLVAQQAEKLGLTEIAHEVFGKLPAWAKMGARGISTVNFRELSEILRQEAESRKETFERYRRGLIPVHTLGLHSNVSLVNWFFGTIRACTDSGFPLRSFPLLTRHAALAGEQAVQLDSNEELFLDLTSILVLSSLDLLDSVESAFPKIAVPSRLTAWLQDEADKLQHPQPENLAAQQQALRLVEDGRIKEWAGDPGFTNSSEGWAARMGPQWCERLIRVTTKAGVLVDFLPLTAKQPEMELVVLPEAEAAYVVSVGEIIESLEAGGRVSSAGATEARTRLGLLGPASNPPRRTVHLHSGLEVHLEAGIAESLALAMVLKPLSEIASVFVYEFEVQRWRDAANQHQANAAVLSKLDALLAHISTHFDAGHYRAHECGKPQNPPGHVGPLSEKELCIQDVFDYAVNGPGIFCVDDRFLRGLRREPRRPTIDVFDLVHHLQSANRLSDDTLFDMLGKLRVANLRYLPLSEPEILHHLRRAPIAGGEVIETVGLRVLRRSLAAALLDAEWMQRPQTTTQGQTLRLEFEFPIQLYLALAHTLVEVWRDAQSSPEERAARSRWLWHSLHFDIGLIHQLFGRAGPEMTPAEALGHSFAHLFGQGFLILPGEQENLRAGYFAWLFDYCIAPNLLGIADLLVHIAKPLRALLDDTLHELDQAERTAGPKSQEFIGRVVLMGKFLFDLPRAVLDALKLSAAELNRFGLARAKAPSEVLGIDLDPSEFWPVVARALDRGYAAILKRGTRLQFRHDAVTGRVWVKRKGQDAQPGGYLNVPCMMLVASQRAERLKALEAGASWFDLSPSCRHDLFQRLVDIANPADRMRQLHERLEKSAAWFYQRFEDRAKTGRGNSPPINISELFPDEVNGLREHLRLGFPQGAKTEQPWNEAVIAMLAEEGLEETIVRCSCLPVRLPAPVFDHLRTMNQTEVISLLNKLNVRLRSTLQRLQFLLIALRFGEDSPNQITRAKDELTHLLGSGGGTCAIGALLALVRWSDLRIGWASSAQEWSPQTKLRVAWVHASRLHSAFIAGGAPQVDLADWIVANSQSISAAHLNPVKELGWDSASPSGLTPECLLILATADFAAQLPADIVAQLDLSCLFQKWLPADELLPAFFSVWHDQSLRSNHLSSYLGDVSEEGLRVLIGDTFFQYLTGVQPLAACERALADLQKDPHQPGPWHILYFATNGAPLPPAQAAVMDDVIQKLSLLASLNRNALETERLILLATGFASRNRPEAVVKGLLQQLLQVAAKASVKFRGIKLERGSDDDATRLGAALLEGTWECSLVRNDAPGTIARFAHNLSLLILNWPAVAGISELAVSGVMKGMSIAYQQACWPAVLTCRAWS